MALMGSGTIGEINDINGVAGFATAGDQTAAAKDIVIGVGGDDQARTRRVCSIGFSPDAQPRANQGMYHAAEYKRR